MKKVWRHLLAGLFLILAVLMGGCTMSIDMGDGEESTRIEVQEDVLESTGEEIQQDSPGSSEIEVREEESYSSKEEVAAYLNEYGHLPDNFITKKEAAALGWDSKKGNLWEVAPGKSIGGDHFGNYEGILPSEKNYKECDIDYSGGRRGAKRIVFSDDGCIYYTEDHYETFELLYGEE